MKKRVPSGGWSRTVGLSADINGLIETLRAGIRPSGTSWSANEIYVVAV